MKKLFLIPFLAIFLFACESNTKTSENPGSENQTMSDNPVPAEEAEEVEEEESFPDPNSVGNFGAALSAEAAIGSVDLLSQLGEKDSVKTKFTGTIGDICQSKGCWMTMDMGDDQEMTVKFTDYGFFAPMNAMGKPCTVEGWAYREVVSVEELQHLAQDNNASQEEIDAITEVEERITFMADGILVEEAAE